MKKNILTTAIIATTLISTPAFAQESEGGSTVYAGVNAGYHDLGAGDIALVANDDSFIYGGYIGVDVPAGETLIVGVEGNFNLGTGAIDTEYGITAKLGAQLGEGGQIFLRGGYQFVDLDLESLTGVSGANQFGVDDSIDDYLVGIGAQVQVSEKVSIRAVFDTISFDTTRATVGLQFNF